MLLALLGLLCAAPTALAAGKPPKGPAKGAEPAARTATIGIADQKDIFGDPRFQALGIRHARRSVAWDSFDYEWALRDVDEWLRSARANGIEPVLTFARSRVGARRHVMPTRAQMRISFRKFRERYPWVRDYAVWNEANHYGEPTGRRPRQAGLFFRDMRRACASCRILGADLLDMPNMVRWTKEFLRSAGSQPRYWGLHNYVSANRFQLGRTQELLAAVKGEVWLTETGGLVARRNTSTIKLPAGPAHAKRVTEFILGPMLRLSPRITRVYLYHWSSDKADSTWDSGLVDAAGRPRPSLAVLERVLRTPPASRPAGAAPRPSAPPASPRR